MSDIHQTCRDAVGKRVRYKGTYINERKTHGWPAHGLNASGEGICKEQHDAHGLCIMVEDKDGEEHWIEPIEVIILEKGKRSKVKYRSIDDEWTI
jgi:hypothetical protein